ncbi:MULTISPECIES: DUF5997 family protein [Rhodococcus]|uniref:DUF5997 family protein n=1 Tax=Rhodococcus TaxID=1827 RepID=UPI000BC614B8|nr:MULTISPECIES: DUF5997 family protein [Rhodococcus]MCZ4554040.1 DUF5997 family protein [Rhodococcus maanshanensis]PTR43826.1 hypothetical protein C8K38_106179 [Rhodococcus sp. OK611]SNX90644.1 hypothetical protein SAMN05447004_106179 [Rhodococcus sp. OK270]
MSAQKTPQTMKPATAAKKLDVYLEATPAEFRDGVVTRDELAELRTNPPQWLIDLRAEGPHPKSVVADKLGVSIAGLARGGVEEALTTAQIEALLADQPDWLQAERKSLVEVRKDEKRIKEQQATRREQSNRKQRFAKPIHHPNED